MFGMDLMFKKQEDNCLEWTGGVDNNGYGRLYYKGKHWRPHRLIMSLLYPKEFKKFPNVNHKCDNRLCYNPNHLYFGTAKDNALDKREYQIPVKWRSEHRGELL